MNSISARRWVFTTVLAGAVSIAGYALFMSPVPLFGQTEQQVEITIKDFAYSVNQVPLKLHIPTVITIRNDDPVRHDFRSGAFNGSDVEIEHEGVIVYGQGLDGMFLDPSQGAAIYTTPVRSGRFEFWCSIHRHMKGEILLLTVGEV